MGVRLTKLHVSRKLLHRSKNCATGVSTTSRGIITRRNNPRMSIHVCVYRLFLENTVFFRIKNYGSRKLLHQSKNCATGVLPTSRGIMTCKKIPRMSIHVRVYRLFVTKKCFLDRTAKISMKRKRIVSSLSLHIE